MDLAGLYVNELALGQVNDLVIDDYVHLALQYEEILFVGKSIGTAGAAWLADKLHIPVRQVVFTPLEMTFAWPLNDAIVFTGTADPWVPQGRIPELCAEKNIPCHSIEEGNHSLETGDWLKDLETVRKVITEVSRFV